MPNPGNPIKHTSQAIDNWSFDESYWVSTVLPLELDPAGNVKRQVTGDLAVKVTVLGSITYVAEASPGSLQADPVWRCKKIDETTGTVITWCDGNVNFDNTATDLTALSYS